jgi:hypothetical protein
MRRAIHKVFVFFVVFASVAIRAQTPAADDGRLFVGFLDDDREEMANWKPGVAQQRLIRPAFERTRSGWQAITRSSLPPRLRWTVAFDGKKVGEIESRAGSVGLTIEEVLLTPAAAVPVVGAPSSRFAGVLAGGPGTARRPLVLVSKPYFSDPDGWKRLAKPTDEVAALVRSAFRREFPHVTRCKDEEVVEKDWKFPDSSLEIVTVYTSNKRSFVAETRLNAGNCGYVDDPNDPLSDPWFFVSEAGVVRRFGSFMTLLDAGDYDNDGRSELVFFLSQPEDTDGFVLFDADLREQARLTWSYH